MIITFKNDEDVICISDTSKFINIIVDIKNGRISGITNGNNKIHIYFPYVKGDDGQFYSFKGIIPSEVVHKDLYEMMDFINKSLANKEEYIVLKYN